MIRKYSLTLLSLFGAAVLGFAQPNVKAHHPESNTDGKKLTMETTILDRNIYPERIYAQWEGQHICYIDRAQKSWMLTDVEGQESKKFNPEATKAMAALPEGAVHMVCGDKIAYTLNKSLYYIDAEGKTYTVAQSDNENIIYGEVVSRNEFGIDGGIFWSPDGSKLAFYRKDDSKVSTFPLLDITSRTGTLKEIKYPMTGMDSEVISLGIYDLASGKTVYADVTDFQDDRYLTNITWSPDSKHVLIQVLDRSQKNMNLNMYESATGKFEKKILEEHNDKFVEPLDPLYFVKGSDLFIYKTNNRDAYKNLYLCDYDGNIRRITCVDADVEYVANDGKSIYYTSAEVSPVENHLFRIDIKLPKKQDIAKVKIREPKRLTLEEGWHDIAMREDCSFYIDNYSSFDVPGFTYVKSTDGKYSRKLHEAKDPLADYANVDITLGTVKSADGKYDNWYRLYKPLNFDPSKKYPVIVYVYGGPHSQMVQNNWLGNVRMWEVYMAQRGYLVYVQDNRGTLNQGAEFEKAIHGQCGQAEMADQMVGIEMLKSLPYVDADRIGVHGWSYGGFMTISLMTNHPDVFKVGVAGGPVIDWKWYEVMYGERYMETEATNPEGYAKVSLINKAADLKGKLLICQGAIDNTVVWEHSLSFVQECIENNVQLDYFPYPRSEHNVFGKWRVHLMDKVTQYFDENL